ncbi:MAG: GDSL family lipase [Clostridia bacterium]|nr:GDSL family lipase [Clostridia bacterium]
MKIIKKLATKQKDVYSVRPVTIAFFGDSVTQGCFEVYQTSDSSLETVFDQAHAYHSYVKEIFASMFPASPVNIINAGISGDNAANALSRLDRDVLSYKPDLVVVCFGLNDCASGDDGIETYASSLKKIITKIKEAEAEVIVMTPNMMADTLSVHVVNDGYPFVRKCIEGIIEIVNKGVLDRYVEKAREVAAEEGVPVCDVYAKWQSLKQNGADINEMLANHVNHPTREMNKIFAYALVFTMLENR